MVCDVLKEKRSEILALAERYGARSVRVFGSVARGEETPTSDVDVLVEFADDRSLYDLVGLQQELERLIGRRADVLTEQSISPYLRDRILAEARPL